MESTVHVYSQEFLQTAERDPFSIPVDEALWREAFTDSQTEGRIFLRLQHQDKEWIGPIGNPIKSEDPHSDADPRIYMPLWLLDSLGLEGVGEPMRYEILTNEAFPNATKIVLRVIDSAFYNSDIREELESALTKLGVLRKHTTLQIPVSRLDNFPVELFVSQLEPADCVLCDGEEVAVEFEEPVDHFEPPPRPPTPVPVEPPRLPDETHDLMVPSTPPVRARQGFTPFQGEGRLLGDSQVNPPEWRRGLPPPRRQP